MTKAISSLVLVLVATLISTGCSKSGESGTEKNAAGGTEQVDATIPIHHCYQNEYPFDSEPDQKDVEVLTLEIVGDRAIGEYNWLPAFKDRRVGQFEGSFDGQTVTASYKFTQEGQSMVTTISIRLEPERVVIKGEKPELGLNASIARVDC